MRLADEGEHVVLTHREELNVLDEYHLLILLLEHCRLENGDGILGITLGNERHSLSHALWGLDETLALGVLAKES